MADGVLVDVPVYASGPGAASFRGVCECSPTRHTLGVTHTISQITASTSSSRSRMRLDWEENERLLCAVLPVVHKISTPPLPRLKNGAGYYSCMIVYSRVRPRDNHVCEVLGKVVNYRRENGCCTK